jgi:methionyl-tRNA formyltransferase
MRIVFCGTPQFAVPTLNLLMTQRDFNIAAVVTQPDRPRGRGHQLSFSPVKETALAAGLPILQPEKIRAPEVQEQLIRLAPDCIVIIAYGQIIPARLLPIPRYGWINLHASLLPEYRGAAPINWAISNGETETGLTTMRIDAGMDTGEMLLQHEMRIDPKETAPELTASMAEAGAPLMAETLRRLQAGTLTSRAQNPAEATYAPLLKKEDGRIDWQLTAPEIYNRMRGFVPWPGSYTTFRGQTCHLWGEPVPKSMSEDGQDASESAGKQALAPGTIQMAEGELHVSCSGGTKLRILSVKMEGRKQIQAMEFARATQLTEEERFGNT